MNYATIWQEAVKEGKKAHQECTPVPVGFYPAGLMGEPLGPTEIVTDGNCGGAYMIVWNSRDPFVKWLKENKPSLVSKNYKKGYVVSTYEAAGEFRSQSHERATACAIAMAKVFNDNGITVGVRDYLT